MEKQAENQSTVLGQSTEASTDPTDSLVLSELELTETGQTDRIPPPTESQQVHTQTANSKCDKNITDIYDIYMVYDY